MLRSFPIQKSGAAIVLAAVAGSASAQNFLGSISTQGLGDGPAKTYGLAFSPNGDLYVTCPGFSSAIGGGYQNHIVVRINTSTNQIVNVLPTGLAPREIAFATPPSGPSVGIVGSEDGTITIFNAATDELITDIPLGLLGIPRGIVFNENHTIAYVSFGAEVSTAAAIDLDPASPTQFQWLPNEGLQFTFGGPTRMVRAGNSIVALTTELLPNGLGLRTHIEHSALPGNAPAAGSRALMSSDPSFTAAPQAEDIALAPDGMAYIVGSDLLGRVYGYDTNAKTISRSFPSGTKGYGNVGIALSPNGRVAVICDRPTNEISFVDVARGLPFQKFNVLELPPSPYYLPQNAVFSPDGTKVYVTTQCSESVLVFSAPPSPAPYTPGVQLHIGNTTPKPYELVHVWTTGATNPGDQIYIMSSFYDDAMDFGPWGVLHIPMESMTTVATSEGDLDCEVYAPTPHNPTGKNYVVQAILFNPWTWDIRLSDEHVAIIQ